MVDYDQERDLGELLDRLTTIYRRLTPQRQRLLLDDIRIVMQDYEAEAPVGPSSAGSSPSISRAIHCPCCGESLTVTLTCNA